MNDDELALECPTCRKRVDYHRRSEFPFFPFCSERCKLIDLGKWLKEEHRIVEPLSEHRTREAESEGDQQKKDET